MVHFYGVVFQLRGQGTFNFTLFYYSYIILQIWILERVDLCHRAVPRGSGPALVGVEKVDPAFESWKRSQAEALTRMQKISACRIKMDEAKLDCVRN